MSVYIILVAIKKNIKKHVAVYFSYLFCFSLMFLVNMKGLWPLYIVFTAIALHLFLPLHPPCLCLLPSSLTVDVFATYRACELTLLRPLWQLFMSMENSLSQDPTSVTVLLPLHRALTELFFIAEARATVSETPAQIYTQALKMNRPHLLL